jgi:hypothetical protein
MVIDVEDPFPVRATVESAAPVGDVMASAPEALELTGIPMKDPPAPPLHPANASTHINAMEARFTASPKVPEALS